MQTTHFIKYIADANAARQVSETEAASLVKEFPYCQSGQLLLAIHLNQNNHLLFEQQLKKSAIYSADRKRLFDLISATETKEQAIVEVEKTTVTKIVLEQNEPIVEVTEPTKKPIEIKPVDSIDELAKNERDKLLELEYINQAISNSYSLELEDEEKEVGSQKSEVSHNPPLLRGGRGSEVKEDLSELVEAGGSQMLEDFDENSEFTFSDWLKHLPTSDKKNDEKISQHKKIKLDLIDKFIQEDPKIKPKKTEFYSPINMARLSVVDDSDLVSETLALIQVEQGSYEEAIKTYQKLSLKNPEKRSYFANQIKILKQKIK